jgi:hypothetical protein
MVNSESQDVVVNKAVLDSKDCQENQVPEENLEELLKVNLFQVQLVNVDLKDSLVQWEKRVNQDILGHMESRVNQVSVENLD